MSTADALRLEAHLKPGRNGVRAWSVRVLNKRPLAARILIGRRVEDALTLVPMLFSLCGQAQTLAATAACSAAGHRAASQPTATEANRRIMIESVQEHVWRLLLDWPPLFGHEPLRKDFALLHRRSVSAIDAPELTHKLGNEILALLESELRTGFLQPGREAPTLDALVGFAQQGGVLGKVLAELIQMVPSVRHDEVVPTLKPHAAAEWCGQLGTVPSDAFCRAPVWDGVAHETGALARHADSPQVALLLAAGHRIAARFVARAVNLAECARGLCSPQTKDLPKLLDSATWTAGTGLATVETARGLLLHVLRIEDERIADYAIIAPTEWNFHPDGVFVTEGSGGHAPDRAAALLRLRALALALDPCVDHEVVPMECEHA